MANSSMSGASLSMRCKYEIELARFGLEEVTDVCWAVVDD